MKKINKSSVYLVLGVLTFIGGGLFSDSGFQSAGTCSVIAGVMLLIASANHSG